MSIPFNISNPVQPTDPNEQSEMTSTAQDTLAEHNEPKAQPDPAEADAKKIHDDFRARIDSCKQYRRKLIPNWTLSIDYRRGKPFTSQTDDDQVAVNLDWSMTKAKQASLFSQVPKARLDYSGPTVPKGAPWVSSFECKLNDTLVESGIESAMDECLPDCINAAGIGAVLVSFESILEDKEVPKQDLSLLPPEVMSQVLQTGEFNGEPLEMETVKSTVATRYLTQRISPSDLLWSLSFTGANFDNAPWIGRSGRITWPEALNRFPDLKPEDKEKVLAEDRPMMDKLTHDVERDKSSTDEMVGFDEVFYKEFAYSSDAKSFDTIHHLVFVNGKTEPVVDEPWNGQKVDEETGEVTGATRFPIRVLTLTYITDETIPPSDSAIGRPQVNEINKARTQMIRQRERSLPIRWFDVNRIDPTIQQSLMRGTWQAMIPVQGEGSRTIGEVSRAQMPQENFMFDKIAKADLNEEWTIHPAVDPNAAQNKEGGGGQAAFSAQVGRERAKVGAFFAGIAEVLGGLLCLYEDPASFGQGFNPSIAKKLKCSILADSTILLDAGQRLSRLNQFINTYAKSGWVNIEPVLQEIASLTGLDPSQVIRAPQPKPPVEPNISLRLTGVEDLLTPLALAFMIKSGQAPSSDLIEQAKALIQQSVTPPQPPPGVDPNSMPSPLGAPPMGQGSPLQGPLGAPPAPGAPLPQGGHPPGPPLPSPTPGPPQGAHIQTPPPLPHKIGEAHPNWTAMTKIDKRTDGGQG